MNKNYRKIQDRLKRFVSDELVTNIVVVFTGTSFASLLNFAYHLIAVRVLNAADFGTFNTFASIFIVIAFATSPFSIAFTRYFTEYITKKDFHNFKLIFSKAVKYTFIITIILFVVFLITANALAVFLKTSPVFLLISGAVIALSLFSLPLVSFFQSLQKFKFFSFLWLSSSITKLVVGGGLLLCDFGILGGLFGFLLGPLSIIVLSLLFLPKSFLQITPNTPERPLPSATIVSVYKYFFPVFIATASFACLTNVDVVLVKHFFAAPEVGYYSIAQLLAKILLLLPTAIAVVIFPKSTEAFIAKKPSLALLKKSLLAAAIICFFVSIFMSLSPDLFLGIITGTAHTESSVLIGIFSLSMSFFGLSWIVMNFLLAAHNVSIAKPLLVLAIAEAFFIYNCHGNLKVVVSILLGFSIATFLFLFVTALNNHLKDNNKQ